MSLLAKLARKIPHPSAQGAADTFLAGVGGGAVGAGLGAATSEDGMVPGMLLGAGVGAGAKGLLGRLLSRMTPEQIEMLLKRINGGGGDAL